MNISTKTSLALIALLTYHGTMMPMNNELRLLNDPIDSSHKTRHILLSDGSVVSTGNRYPNSYNKKLPAVINTPTKNIVIVQYPSNNSFWPVQVAHEVRKAEKFLPNNIRITTWNFEPVNNPR